MNDASPKTPEAILIVEDDVLVRFAISDYLRHCGYRVVEAASADEAIIVLTQADINLDIVFSAVEMPGSMDGFGLAKWLRANRPELRIVLASSVAKAAHVAGQLCEEGPHLKKPYEPEQVMGWIKKLRNLKMDGGMPACAICSEPHLDDQRHDKGAVYN